MHRNENLLAKRINTSENCSSYDQLCKRLLANKQILAWIQKGCVAEFAECSLQDIAEKYIEGRPGITAVPIYPDECSEFIEGAVTEDLTMMEGTVSFDIHFRAIKPDSDTSVILIFNIEAQKDICLGNSDDKNCKGKACLPQRKKGYCRKIFQLYYQPIWKERCRKCVIWGLVFGKKPGMKPGMKRSMRMYVT